jgi:hypothetical protein
MLNTARHNNKNSYCALYLAIEPQPRTMQRAVYVDPHPQIPEK